MSRPHKGPLISGVTVYVLLMGECLKRVAIWGSFMDFYVYFSRIVFGYKQREKIPTV